ncbi:MAG: flavodoxin family protein [Chloroflexi bacterium]|nr:flavodoxin family protein [Chloroflexota bacterium]
MKVLGIAGSPRRHGNTEELLDSALDGARIQGAATEKLVLLDMKFSGCICPESEDCQPTGQCSVMDDMQSLYPKLRAADLLFLASPICFRSVSAQTKALIDRCQALWVTKYLLKRPVSDSGRMRPGLFISVSDREDPKEFHGAILTVRSFFISLNVLYKAELLFMNIEKKGDVFKHPTALEKAFETGAKLVEKATATTQ